MAVSSSTTSTFFKSNLLAAATGSITPAIGRLTTKVLPLPGAARHRDLATVRRHDLLHDREAEAGAPDVMDERVADAVEPLEDLLLLVGRDADAEVPDRDARAIAVAIDPHP